MPDIIEPLKPKVEEFKIEDFETLQLPTATQSTDNVDPQRTDTSAAEKLAKEQAGTKQGVDKGEKTAAPAKEEKVEATKEKKEEGEVAKGAEEKQDEATLKKNKEGDITRFMKKPGQKEEVKVEGKKEEKQTEIKAPSKITRDYTQYAPEDVAVFKQMSDSAYQYTTKLLKEKKDLTEASSKTYLQHENAYLLDPGFHEITNKIRLAGMESEIYKEQLKAIDEGKEVGLFKGFNNQGQPVFDALQKPNSALTEEIRIRLMNVTNIANQSRGQMQQYPERYKQGIATDMLAFENERKARFAWAANPEMLDYQIEVPGMGARSLKQVKEDMASVFPAYMRNHPAVSVVGDLMIALRLSQAEIQELKSGNQVTQVQEEEAKLVEPSTDARARDVNTGKYKVKEFSALPADF